MSDTDKKIKERKKEALRKDFYGKGQKIVQKLGDGKRYDDGDIRVERHQWSQEWTGGEDNIEIFAQGKSVFKGDGNEYAGPGEDGIKRYVPGDWEQVFNAVARIADPVASKKNNDLRNDWGL